MRDTIGDSDFERTLPNDEDQQIACVYAIVGLGTQQVKKYKSEEYEDKKQLIMLFELTEDFYEFKGDEIPLTITRLFNRSLNERSNLYKFLLNWRGKKFLEGKKSLDWEEIVGGLGMIEIENKKAQNSDKVYTNVLNFNKIQKGVPVPESIYNKKILFDISDSKPNFEMFLLLPKWIRKKIEDSKDWRFHLKNGIIPQSAIDSLSNKVDSDINTDQKEEVFEKATSSKSNDDDDDDPFFDDDPNESDPFDIEV